MTVSTDPLHGLRQVYVDVPTLKRVDTSGLANGFGRSVIRKVGADAVRGLRGKVLLTYDVDDDPRPIWRIPAVRRFTRRLHEAVPHLPYFLSLVPDFAQWLVMFAPLADVSALTDTSADFRNPPLRKAFLTSLDAMRAFAVEAGDDPDAVAYAWLSVLPKELTIGIEGLRPN